MFNFVLKSRCYNHGTPSIYRDACRIFQCNYDDRNFGDNGLGALKATIDFVQRNEARLTDIY